MNRLKLTLLALPLLALGNPANAGDQRLVERLYDPSDVVRVDGRTNVQATIMFADDELIENVAIGNSSTWQVTPNKRANLLFVKPLQPNASTNMTVITNERTYLFDLVANPRSKPLYVLKFTYPEDPSKKAPAPLAGPNDLETAAAQDPYAVVDPAKLNYAWSREGAANLLPSQIYDDGDATFLTWPKGEAVPAILMTNVKDEEGPVNYSVRGDTIVVDGVPSRLILRSGEDVAALTHQPSAATAEPAPSGKKSRSSRVKGGR